MEYKFYNYDDLYYVCQRLDHYIEDSYCGYKKNKYLDLHISVEYRGSSSWLFSYFIVSAKSVFGCYIINKLKEHEIYNERVCLQ